MSMHETSTRPTVPTQSSGAAMTEAQTALDANLTSARDRLHTPDDIGRALVDYVLSEAAMHGTMSLDSGKIEVPLTATIQLPQGANFESSTGTAKLCITAFGYEIICMEATLSGSSS